ncbi:MAG: hypothetical protein J6Q68_01425 [Clostridia bacterium]|nr:hypothetical protein [Clostridia bacterium]
MKTEKLNEHERLEYYKELYVGAKNAHQEKLSELDTYMQQYLGSDLIDGSSERACAVRNITYEMIESEVSSDIPPPKVDPSCYSERRDRNAKSIERLLASVRDRLPYEEMNDLDERYTYVLGSSVWYAEWDNEATLGNEIGAVKLHCLSPQCFIGQPNIPSVEDMEYCFLEFTSTRGELIRKYNVEPSKTELADFDFRSEAQDTDSVRIVVCFYKDSEGEIGKFIFSGDLVLLDMPRYYMRKEKVCSVCGTTEHRCTCGKKMHVSIDLTHEITETEIETSGRIIPRGVHLPYYTPKSFPIVIRKNTTGDRTLFGQSDCHFIRPQQQSINKIESRILQKLLRAGITPIVPEDATISLNNTVFGQVIKMKPGESASQYGKVDTTPDISQDIAEAERLYDQAKRILGISDALMGSFDYRHESGYARQLQISQATGRLESKRKMKHTAYASLDRIIFELYLAFADEARTLSYKDAYGRIHNAKFNKYDFLDFDQDLREYYYDDAYLFSVDLNGGAEYQREALWERNLENLKAGTLGNPESPATLLRYWQCQERAHYPYARENVEYFTLAMNTENEEATYGEDSLALYSRISG